MKPVLLAILCFVVQQGQAQDNVNQSVFADKVVKVFTTAKNTSYRISPTDTVRFSWMGQPLETEVCVFVDPSRRFQTLLGIGGALTDASAETFYKLPEETQKELLRAYYDTSQGIGYTIGRTNINSCDFSSDSYTYVKDNDVTLTSFNLSHDEKFKIPFIKEILKATRGRLNLFVSPWSPPAWMKDNNDMLHGGKLKPEFRQSWANYYIKFIQDYEAQGIPVWGLTVQNEPMANQKWESCIYTATEERDFIKQYLGPTLAKANMGDKRLMCWDHNRDLIYQRVSTILSDPQAANYIWGIGYHWYETWTGSGMEFENVRKVAETFPDKKLVFTEGCAESFNESRIHEWSLGERYGHSMVNDFNNGTVAWTDWNILLDEKGGPNHAGNFCFAPIHGDTKTGKLIYTNSYYYIGQFSKFILPGARRIISSSNRDKLETTAFINSDGTIAVVVLNTSDDAIDFKLWINGYAAASHSLAHSISTLLIK